MRLKHPNPALTDQTGRIDAPGWALITIFTLLVISLSLLVAADVMRLLQ